MAIKIPDIFSPGLKELATEFCVLRRTEALSPVQWDKLRELLELATTVTDAKTALRWFFKADDADEYIKARRPNLSIQLIVVCYHMYELYTREHTVKLGKPDRDRMTDEYKMMRGKNDHRKTI